MATNWIVPTGTSIRTVLDALAQELPNQNIAEGTASGSELVLAEANRRDELVAKVVREVRGAIQNAGRMPLSVTEAAVPPDGEYHTLVIAAWRLVNSTPGLVKSFLAGDGEVKPLERLYNEAKEWLDCVRKGDNIVLPTDPTGQDYLTAVSDTNLAISGLRWGDSTANDDEYDAGVTAEGYVVTTQSNYMNTQ